jgi:lysophospholipase L1-like esterase
MTGIPVRRVGARAGVCLAALVLLGRCSGDTPTSPPPPGIVVICPANISSQASQGQPGVTVIYPAPTVSGGKPPLTTTCTPASGTSFAVGTTPISCAISDAALQSASCTFSVIVAPPPPPPKLSVTTFMAFGDSLTEGKVSAVLDQIFLTSYTIKLGAMLQSRYSGQNIVVANEGNGGNKAVEDVDRFDLALNTDKPQAVLLMEGANDLNKFGDAGVDPAINALGLMGSHATARGITVFLATLPPENPAGANGSGAPIVSSLNAKIVSLAARQQLILVDVNAAFHGDLTLIGADGLHPTDAGHQVIAQAFYDRIVARLEVAATATSTASLMGGRQKSVYNQAFTTR